MPELAGAHTQSSTVRERDLGRALLALDGASWPFGQVLQPSAAEKCLIISSDGNAAISSIAHHDRSWHNKGSKMRDNKCLLDNRAIS